MTTQVKLKGNPISLGGELPKVGNPAPNFRLVKQDMSEISLDNFKGKIKIILAVPSLDTAVCAKETRVFSEKVASMDNVVLITVSGDLPFAMNRFCTTEGIRNVICGSQYRNMNFSKSYGTHIQEGGLKELSARATFVIDANNQVQYVELVPDIAEEPNYDRAIRAVQSLLAS